MRASAPRVAELAGRVVAAVVVVVVVAGAACAPPVSKHDAPPPDDNTPPAKVYDPINGTFVVDSVDAARPVTFHVPTDYDPATAYPVVVLLAGYGVTGAQFDQALAFRAFADAHELVYAAPEGRKDQSGSSFWNASDACCDFAQTQVDDSGYLADVVSAARDVAHVSVAYVIGHSNGGFMAQRLACDHADLFDAVVSVSGAMPNDCHPAQPIAVLEAHGTADQTIFYDGGTVDARVPAYPSAAQTASSWAALNHCAATAVNDPAPIDLDTSIVGPETTVARYPDCDAGGAVELWTSAGGQHVPRGGADYLATLLGFLTTPR